MGFNLGAGLAEMGKSIAQTAGDAALNIQRAELDRQRIELADSLQGARESKNRQETSLLNEVAAEKDRNWRRAEAEKKEAADTERFNTREENETARTKISNDRILSLHKLSEAAADGRLEKQLAAASEQAKALIKDKEDNRLLESARNAGVSPVQVEGVSASGVRMMRTVMVPDPEKIAKALSDRPDLAAPYVALAAKFSGKGKDGKVNGRPPLASFQNLSGAR